MATSSPSASAPTARAVNASLPGRVLLCNANGEGDSPALADTVERPRSALEQAWVQFLSPYQWLWFATFTFREAVHPEAADKKFRFWVRLLNERNVGAQHRRPRMQARCAQWVRGLEWQKRDVLHYHALIANLPPYGDRAERDYWSATWNGLYAAGFAFIKPIADVGGVCGYVSKYVSKGGQIDVSPNLPPLIHELRVASC